MDNRPCGGCERGSPFEGDFKFESQCKVCWLYYNEERYRLFYDGQPVPPQSTTLNGLAIVDCVKDRWQELKEEKIADKIEKDEVTNEEKYHSKEDTSEEKYPSKVKQAISLATATSEWVKEGKPLRSDEECSRIHKICEGCSHFNAKEDRCKKCGCGLSTNASTAWIYSLGIPDGIRMASHSCPIGRW